MILSAGLAGNWLHSNWLDSDRLHSAGRRAPGSVVQKPLGLVSVAPERHRAAQKVFYVDLHNPLPCPDRFDLPWLMARRRVGVRTEHEAELLLEPHEIGLARVLHPVEGSVFDRGAKPIRGLLGEGAHPHHQRERHGF
jgi:hypothetical protein